MVPKTSMGGGFHIGGAKLLLLIAVVVVLVLVSVTAYSLNLLTPGFVIETYVNGKPVNAFIQVFAVLPPGGNASLVEVWNGTAFNGVARVPITALAKIAKEWVIEGYGGEGVGVEVVATYVNKSTVYYNMWFTTYQPDQLLNTINNPLISAARLNYETMRLNLDLKTELGTGFGAGTPQIPTPPAPPGCWWNVLWSWPTPQEMIPVAWVFDKAPNYLGGLLGAYSSQQTSATVYFYASAGITQGGSAGITYRFIGTSAQVSTTYWTALGFGLKQPSGGFIYHLGTLGIAELQLVCITGSTNQYVYEAYVASIANNGQLYYSTNMSYIGNLTTLYSKYTGTNLQYVPFDEIYVGGGSAYSYWFSNIQTYSSPFGMVGAIPIGSIIAYAAKAASKALSVSGFILANLAAGLQVSTTQVSIILISVNQASSVPAYGDLLVVALPVTYSQSAKNYYYYPYILGFNVTSLGRYSSGTSMYVDGPGVVYNPCVPIFNSYNWTVYVYIGNSPLLVPGGSVTAMLYDPSGKLVWSGTFSVPTSFDGSPPHGPAVVSVPWTVFNYGVPYNTYTMVITYNGYTTKYGSISYGTSTTKFTIYAEYQSCSP